MTENGKLNGSGDTPVSIKKYANRRLYNTRTSSYITLDYLAQMVRDGVDFTVHDAKTGEDITRSVLTQIIVEEEAKGQNLLPIGFLRQLISLYGDSLQGLVPQYLDATMKSFARNQEQIRDYLKDAFGGLLPVSQFEEMSRRNMALFEQAMRVFTPEPERPPESEPEDTEPPPQTAVPDPGGEALDELRGQLDDMQRRLDELSGNRGRS